jgi:hypothetical protein
VHVCYQGKNGPTSDAPSRSVDDPTETLRAPHECTDTYYLMSGRKVSVPPDRLVAMTIEDSKPLLSIGWTTQNNLEIRQTELMASRPIHD